MNTLKTISQEAFENELELFFNKNFDWEVKNEGLVINLESDTVIEGEKELEQINEKLSQKGLKAELKNYYYDRWNDFYPKAVYGNDDDWYYHFENFEIDIESYLSDMENMRKEFKKAFEDNKVVGNHVQFYTNNDPNNLDKVIELYSGNTYTSRRNEIGLNNTLVCGYSNEVPVAYVCEITEEDE